MNLNIKATGTREEIAALLRELADNLDQGITLKDDTTEPLRIEQAPRLGVPPAVIWAEPKKKLTIPGHEKAKPERKKSEPLKRAAMCLKRAIAKASELVTALREVFPAATGAAIMVIEDLIADAVKLAQKLVRLESLTTTQN